MEKVGIMRINSYNKFFAKVAEIMNTSIKDVKQLDGIYKVELANHVYLNVYRCGDASLFIHDYRGIAHIASCYDFEDFKTIKDLYDRLVSDYGESAKREVMEVKQELNSRFGKEQPNKIAKIENINHCPNQNTCCIKAYKNFIYNCEQVHKHMKAINNPEWHHVSLATLANIDNNMMDDKRRLYLTVWGELNKTLKNLRKCNRVLSYEKALSPLIRWITELYFNKKITGDLKRYVDIKISMCNVECGVWSSSVEVATGQHESRKYNRPTLRY